jgi:hypothetical protein
MSKVQEKYKNFILSLFYLFHIQWVLFIKYFQTKIKWLSSHSFFFCRKLSKKRNILSQIPFLKNHL